jgi:hypothetical protein
MYGIYSARGQQRSPDGDGITLDERERVVRLRGYVYAQDVEASTMITLCRATGSAEPVKQKRSVHQ